MSCQLSRPAAADQARNTAFHFVPFRSALRNKQEEGLRGGGERVELAKVKSRLGSTQGRAVGLQNFCDLFARNKRDADNLRKSSVSRSLRTRLRLRPRLLLVLHLWLCLPITTFSST